MIKATLLGTLDGKFVLNTPVYLSGIPQRGDIIEFEEKDYRVDHKRFIAQKGDESTEPNVLIFAELKR